jgi:nicotinate-nucleotide--dimethylbenzimidazole phosphoribosyltransferase
MVRNFVTGGAAASVAARALDVALHVVDVGVAHPYGEIDGAAASIFVDPVSSEREGDVRIEDALSSETLTHAIAAGARAVDRLASDTRVRARHGRDG